MSLSNEEKNRYSRHILLKEVNEEGQLKLKKSKVLVIGAGGLGSPILLYLSAAGVGTIGIIDFDTIEESNLQRQILFNSSDVGKSKSITAKEKLEKKNPFISIIALNEKLTRQNAVSIFKQYDIIVDGTDNFSTRYLINDACVLTNKPLVYGAIHRFEGQIAVFNYQNSATYRCLFPEPPAEGNVQTCSEVGVIGILPGIIGSFQANEVLKIILGIGEKLSNKLFIFNALTMQQLEVKIKRNYDLRSIGISNEEDLKKYDYEEFCKIKPQRMGVKSVPYSKVPTDAIVLDIRDEWEKPRIQRENLIIAPMDDIDEFIDLIPKDQTVYVICQTGGRSKTIIEMMERDYKFDNLVNVEGGIFS